MISKYTYTCMYIHKVIHIKQCMHTYIIKILIYVYTHIHKIYTYIGLVFSLYMCAYMVCMYKALKKYVEEEYQ